MISKTQRGAVAVVLTALMGLFIASVAVSGCKPKKKAGGACTGDEASCLDKTNILECQDGKFATMKCIGPKGCAEKLKGATTSGRQVTHNYAVECDFTGNPAGDACLDDGAVCAADKKAMVSCKSKKIQVTACLGAKGCVEGATVIDCDTTIQTLGAECEGEEVACTPDKKQILRCVGAKFVLGQNCRGAKACSVSGQKISCDEGDQADGEPCSPDGNYACTTDKKSLLKCTAFKWKVDEKCKAKKICQTKGDEVGCQ